MLSPRGQIRDTLDIVRVQLDGRFYLDADELPVAALEHEIDFAIPGRAVVVERRLGAAPRDLLAQLLVHERLEHGSEVGSGRFEVFLVDAHKVRQQPGVIQVDLRRLDEPLADVARPGGQRLVQVCGLQQRQIPLDGRLRHRRVTRQLGHVQQTARLGREEREQSWQLGQPSDVGHFPHGQFAIAPRRMHVQIAANVANKSQTMPADGPPPDVGRRRGSRR